MAIRIFSAIGTTITSLLICGSAIAQENPWGRDEVEAHIQSYKVATGVEADPFTPWIERAPAKDIVLSYGVLGAAVAEDLSLPLDPRWSYDAGRQALTISTDPSGQDTLAVDWQGREPSVRLWEGQVGLQDRYLASRQVKVTDMGEGSNAFGAVRRVTKRAFTERGITEVGATSRGPRSGGGYGASSFVHRISIASEEARALTPHLRFEVVARSKDWAPGKWIICGVGYIGATVDIPTVFETDACFISVEIVAVRYVDDRDGTVLKQWDRPGSPRR
ncbi:hypothetical protein D3C80_388300 [compost metagenome]